MQQPSILITGATGFVGAWLVRYFAAQGWAVTATGRGEAPAPLLTRANYFRADLRQPLLPLPADVVVHAAALASDSAPRADLQAANVDGTRHLFAATQHCRCFVYISSASVYDYRLAVHREEEPVDNQRLSPYGQSKRRAEEWLRQQDWRDRTLIILRPRAVYGPGDRVLLPRLLRLVRGGRMMIPGTMRWSCSLTHVENLCAAVAGSLAFAERQRGGIHCFNVADALPYALRMVVGQLLPAVCGRALDFRELPLPPLYALARLAERLHLPTTFTRFGLDAVARSCVLDLKKIKETIDFQPERHFEEALPEIAAWADQVGVAALRAAAADLPWRIPGSLLP
ncbi:MAG: NAD(P)-dependent oxidoreductase [Saprospiraceae bacterium]